MSSADSRDYGVLKRRISALEERLERLEQIVRSREPVREFKGHKFTKSQSIILKCMLHGRGSYDALATALWSDSDQRSDRAIEAIRNQVNIIKTRIGRECVVNVHGWGYKLTTEGRAKLAPRERGICAEVGKYTRTEEEMKKLQLVAADAPKLDLEMENVE